MQGFCWGVSSRVSNPACSALDIRYHGKMRERKQKLSAIEQQVPPNDSRTQLVAVLERLTLALDTPEPFALGSDTEAFVEVLERLTLALKASDHKAITGKTESIPTDTGQDNPMRSDPATPRRP